MPVCGRLNVAKFCAVALFLLMPCALQAMDAVTLDVSLVDKGRALEGRAAFTIVNDTGAPLEHVSFWLYPNRFAKGWKRPREHEVEWLYPRGKSEGRMTLHAVEVDGVPLSDEGVSLRSFREPGQAALTSDLLADIRLPAPLAAGQSVRIDTRFRVTIPLRRGRFGRHGGVISLCGGFYPIPVDRQPDGLSRVPPSLDTTLRVRVPAGLGLVSADGFALPGQGGSIATFHAVDSDVPLIFMDRMTVTQDAKEGVDIVHIMRDHRPAAADFLDRIGRAMDIAGGVLGAHLAQGGHLPGRLILVEIPAFDRLVQLSGSTVIMSRQIWRLAPLEKARLFHDLTLARSVGAALSLPDARRKESPGNAELVAETAGCITADLWLQAERRQQQSVSDLVRFASFIPYVDNLIYAPQIPFEHAYTASTEEPDALRDELWRFNNELPRGRRIATRLEDRIGKAQTRRLMKGWHEEDHSFFDLLIRTPGIDGQSFLADWWGRYPVVQYALADVDSRCAGGRCTHTIRVRRDGAPLEEPVTIRVTFRDGTVEDIVWDGRENPATITLVSRGRIRFVQVDPDARLVESARLTPGESPLHDNRRPMGLRPPLLSEFVIWGDTVTKKPFVHWSVDLRRRHDISHTVVLQGAVTPRRAGGSIGYLRHLGRALTGNDRSWYLGPYLSVNRHMASAAETAIPERNRFAATMASLSVLAGMNNRAVMLDPGDGGAFSVGLGYAAGVGEDGRSARYGALSVRGGRTAAPAPGHRLALYGGAEGRIGTPPASSLATLSARTALRGFDLDETYGQAAIYGVAEWRHTIAGSTGVAFPLGTALDRLQGVLFAGAGTTSPPGGFGGLFHEDNLYAEAGYGLRIFLLALGVAPYLLAVDFAAPIYPLSRYREVRRSDGVMVRERRAPFRLVLGITQTF